MFTNQRISAISAQLLALSAAVTTIYISPMFANYFTKKEIDNPLSLSPPTVIIRTVRPYYKYVIVLGWIYIRFWPHSPELPQDDYTAEGTSKNEITGNPKTSIHDLGFLDYFKDLYSTLTTMVLSYIIEHAPTHLQLQKMASRSMLYINDGLGIMVVASTVRFIQNVHNFSYSEWKERMIQNLFEFAKVHVPMVKKEWEKEENKMEQDLKKSLWEGRGENVRRKLPEDGLDIDSVINVSKKVGKLDRTNLGLI